MTIPASTANNPPGRQLKVLLLDSHTFLKRELINSLRRRSDVKLILASIPQVPAPGQAEAAFEQLRPALPALVITLNEAGLDRDGRLYDLMAATGSHFVNWYYDDPRFEYLFYNRRVVDTRPRIDFVSEASFVDEYRALGFNAQFLPLATDPAFFNTDGVVPYRRDIAFVGNSSMELLDGLVVPGLHADMERHAPLLAKLRDRYFADPGVSLWDALMKNRSAWETTIESDKRQFVFAMEWMVGYLYRRDFIADIARTFKKHFTCFGDLEWGRFIDPSQVSRGATYYDTLCSTYRSTRVNLNLNRIQIRTSFTQRIFDCLASGGFLLTDRRKLNSEYFRTSGEDRELVEYTDLSHCKKLIRHYLDRDEERERIAAAGRAKVMAEHTYDHRVDAILAMCRKTWGW